MVVCSSGASSPWRPELPKERKNLVRSHISSCSWIEQKYKYSRSVHTSLNFTHIFYISSATSWGSSSTWRSGTSGRAQMLQRRSPPPHLLASWITSGYGSKGALFFRTKDFGICERTDKEPCTNHRIFESGIKGFEHFESGIGKKVFFEEDAGCD